MARGANTTVSATIQAVVLRTRPSTGPASSSPRRASAVTLIGLTRTKGCSQPGMVEATTNALLAKVSGNIQMNPADWAVSGLRTDSPIRAATHDRAMPKAMINTNPARAARGLVVIRKPSTMPTVRITSTVAVRRTVSARMRPASTAERAMRRDRKRSMMPLARSSLRPIPVTAVTNTTVWTMMPGITTWTYWRLDPAMAPPKTYTNSSTNKIGWITRKISSWGGPRAWGKLGGG